MVTRVGDVLDTARRQRFVGRHRGLVAFDDARTGRSSRRVLFTHVPGGIGKTTLLQQFHARARAADRTVVQVDGRDVHPSPEGMRTAVRAAIGHDDDGPIAPLPTGAVLLRPPPLDRARFAAAVKAAMQTLHRPDLLAANPLLGSALAATPSGPTTDQLRATIEDVVTRLSNEPKATGSAPSCTAPTCAPPPARKPPPTSSTCP